MADAPPDKREAVLAAALELFAERGFHGTAVPLVAERAGVGTGTIYRHFADKGALVNVLYRRWKRRMGESILTDWPDAAPPRTQFQVLWERLGAFALAHPADITFLEQHHHGDYLDEESQRLSETAVAPMLELLEAWRARRVVKDLPPSVILGIVYGAFGGLLNVCSHLGLEPAEALGLAESALWEAIRA